MEKRRKLVARKLGGVPMGSYRRGMRRGWKCDSMVFRIGETGGNVAAGAVPGAARCFTMEYRAERRRGTMTMKAAGSRSNTQSIIPEGTRQWQLRILPRDWVKPS